VTTEGKQLETNTIEALGGQLLRTRDGDPYLRFASSLPVIFQNRLESNTASLVLYKGQVAVMIPAVALQESDCSVFNVLFQRNQLVIDQYAFGACNLHAGPTQAPLRNGLYEFRTEMLKFDRGKTYGMMADPPMRNLGLSFDRVTFGEVKKKTVKADVLFGIFPYTFAETHATEMRAALLEPFLEQITNNFDATVAAFEKAAGITDPATQLSSHAHYTPITHGQADSYKRILEQRWKETHQSNGGNGWLSALNAMQGAANMQQAMQEARMADLTHNTSAQLEAASHAASAQIQTLGALSGDARPIQPLAAQDLSRASSTLPQPRPDAAASTPEKANSGFTYQPSHGQPDSKAVASNAGTAAPASCVYLSPSHPCVPLAEYKQMQANQPTRIAVETCPQSGFVPGLMRRTSSDTSEGVPCTPGQPIDPSLFASGAPTGAGSSFGSSAGGSGSGMGGSNNAGPFDPSLNNCVVYFYKNDPITGDHLILQNNCSVRAQVYFYSSSQVHGGAAIDPGATDNTYAAHDQILAAGALSIYACPVNDIPRKPDGTLAFNGLNNHFLCSQK
jgi:hypothetical protein